MTEGEKDEAVLDDPDALATADPGEMLRAVATAGAQVRAAVALADGARADLDEVAAEGRPRTVVVAGMGGSGASAEVLASVAGLRCPVPILADRGYLLPGWVGPMDLVVAVSCSGQTEETLAVADEAARRGCRLVTVGAVDSPLAQRSEQARGLHLAVDPGGRPPRANIWSLSVPLLVLADALGLVTMPTSALETTADLLDEAARSYGPAVPTYDNPAKSLAIELSGSLPYLWGSSDLAGVAAVRFANQLSENAKVPSVPGVLPEAHHNQVVAFAGRFGSGAPAREHDLFRDRVDDEPSFPRIRVIVLRDSEEHPQVAARVAATLELAEEHDIPIREVAAVEGSALDRLASLVAVADFASVYLALLEGTDPTPIDPITRLKRRIAR
jgi:glucose/mannose-6-phosphate isomerase